MGGGGWGEGTVFRVLELLEEFVVLTRTLTKVGAQGVRGGKLWLGPRPRRAREARKAHRSHLGLDFLDLAEVIGALPREGERR